MLTLISAPPCPPAAPRHAAESLYELRILSARFEQHALNFKDWLRHGGPIEPIWARETIALRRDLHRAQCRAARRVYESGQESPARCLGALQVYRVQRPPKWSATGQLHHQHPDQQQHPNQNPDQQQQQRRERPRHLEELAACNRVGRFERFGDRDIAFVCDFCDGYLVWEDLREMPSLRAGAPLPPAGDGLEPLSATNSPSRRRPPRPAMAGTMTMKPAPAPPPIDQQSIATAAEPTTTTTTTTPPPAAIAAAMTAEEEEAAEAAAAPDQWQATGFSRTTGAEKTVVHAPTAIANHRAPGPSGPAPGLGLLPAAWECPLLCPFCDEYYYEGAGEDEIFDRSRFAQDEAGFPGVAAFQEHLEWHHTSLAMTLPLPLAGPADMVSNCVVI